LWYLYLPPYLPLVKSCVSRPLPAPAPGWEGGKSRQAVLSAAEISSLLRWKTERPKELDDFGPPWSSSDSGGLGGLTRVLERCIERKNSRSYAQPHMPPPVLPEPLFLNGSPTVWIQIWSPQKLFRWVRSYRVDLGQTWNGVKTRKSRRVMLILVSYVHVLRHLNKIFWNFRFFSKRLNLSRSNFADVLTNIVTTVWTRFYVIWTFRKFATTDLTRCSYSLHSCELIYWCSP